MSDGPFYLGLDIGGTKTAACVGSADGKLSASARMSTHPAEGSERWFERVRDLMADVLRRSGIRERDLAAAGISAPGPMSVARGAMIAPPNLPGWRDVPIVQWMRSIFDCPVRINNDANACALAEYRFGEFAGVPDLVYLTASTGIGAGVISGGRLLQGARDLAGEVGHHVLDIHGPPCPCGRRGCWEIYCGGLNVARRLRARVEAGEPSRAVEEAGGDPARIDFRAVAEAARKGDALALEFWNEFVERMAQGIGTTLMFFNPSVVVLGTIAIHLGERLLDPVRTALSRYAWDVSRAGVRLAASRLGARIGELSALAVAIGEDAPERRP